MQGGECVMFPFEKDTEELEEEEEIEYYPKEYDIDFSSGKLNGNLVVLLIFNFSYFFNKYMEICF